MTSTNSMPEKSDLSSRFEGVDLVGTVGSMYQDSTDIRFETALDTAERYQSAGLPLVVVDNSGPDNLWVPKAFEKREAIVLGADIGGIATQRQQGVSFAVQNGAKKVVGHEPEKNLMPTFSQQIASALNNSDVLVIGRTQTAEDSLPPVQQRTERLAGWILEKTLNLPHDTLSGGRGFSVVGAEVLSDYPAQEQGMNNWLYLYTTLLDARAQGNKTSGINVDLTHPNGIVAQETGNPVFDAKRYMQFNLQLSNLLQRPEVSADMQDLTRYILIGLSQLPVQATPADNPAYESYLDSLEEHVSKLGYAPAAKR